MAYRAGEREVVILSLFIVCADSRLGPRGNHFVLLIFRTDADVGVLKQMESNSVDCACSNNMKEHLKQFIKTWESSPEIWNSSCDAYKDKVKKNKALDNLLNIYKRVRPGCTRSDVRKKLNSLRTNFRREWKKVIRSKSSGGQNVYVPASWVYHELLFLSTGFEHLDYEPPVQQEVCEGYIYKNEWNDVDSESSDPLISTPEVKSPKMSMDYQISIGNEDSDNQQEFSKVNETNVKEEDYHVARVWAEKLNKLEPTQKLFAEKAINDILFEAQLQNLRYKKDSDFGFQ